MIRLLILCLMISSLSFAQKKNKKQDKENKIELPTKQIFREGNKSYSQNDFTVAEKNYKKALELNPNYEKANYNLGNTVYQQKRFEESVPMYDLVTKTTKDKNLKAESYHNIGNAMMKQKKYDKAVEAYKNALRNNPKDDETRYNLALAQKLMKKDADNKEKDKNNKDKNNDKDKEKKDQKENDKDKNKDKNKEEGDKGDKDKDKKGDNKDEPNKDKKGESDKKKKQPQPQKNKLSKQQIQQLLEAMNNEENKTQKKVNAKKAKGRKIKNEKDW